MTLDKTSGIMRRDAAITASASTSASVSASAAAVSACIYQVKNFLFNVYFFIVAEASMNIHTYAYFHIYLRNLIFTYMCLYVCAYKQKSALKRNHKIYVCLLALGTKAPKTSSINKDNTTWERGA